MTQQLHPLIAEALRSLKPDPAREAAARALEVEKMRQRGVSEKSITDVLKFDGASPEEIATALSATPVAPEDDPLAPWRAARAKAGK